MGSAPLARDREVSSGFRKSVFDGIRRELRQDKRQRGRFLRAYEPCLANLVSRDRSGVTMACGPVGLDINAYRLSHGGVEAM